MTKTTPYRKIASDMTSSIIRVLAHQDDRFIRIMRKIEKALNEAYEAGKQAAHG